MHKLVHKIVIGLVLLVLAVPILSTLLYSLATSWGATMLPNGLTLSWYVQLWQDPRFLAALGRSLLLCSGTLLVSLLITVPVILQIQCLWPKLEAFMNVVVIMPFAIPPVVGSVGLLQLYADDPLPLVGTPWILAGAYFTIALPFIYRAISNNMKAINVRELIEAASLLGASPAQAVWRVVLPNIRKGLESAVFISFSFLLGEFVFTNMLAGTRYETVQVYLYNQSVASGHYTSALVITYFLTILCLTWGASRLGRKQ